MNISTPAQEVCPHPPCTFEYEKLGPLGGLVAEFSLARSSVLPGPQASSVLQVDILLLPAGSWLGSLKTAGQVVLLRDHRILYQASLFLCHLLEMVSGVLVTAQRWT